MSEPKTVKLALAIDSDGFHAVAVGDDREAREEAVNLMSWSRQPVALHIITAEVPLPEQGKEIAGVVQSAPEEDHGE